MSQIVELMKIEMVLTSKLVGHDTWALYFESFKQIKFGFVADGECHISGNGISETLKQGEGFILTNLKGFRVGSDAKTKAISGDELYQKRKTPFVKAGNERKAISTVLFGGHFTFDAAIAPTLVDRLPTFTRLSDSDPTVKVLFELIGRETEDNICGSDFVLNRAAQLLLLMGLRKGSKSNIYLGSGWLRAFNDPSLSKAMQLIHTRTSEDWSVESLAKAAGLSRSGFSAQFMKAVGQSPAEYLRGWRMVVARDLLRSSQISIAEVATKVGYQSETAFSTAFRRTVGQQPSKFRES
ncbi:AraC family transcriptional regulator [Bdellovibrio sp. SKB1291214]|uniref:AraC family transcriptional regulator n=1 Tax=Bdellovibrio sp. SKB1291214 TaxID=1732569 RepID=UPI0011327E2A|nr:AraC family transcriptional regulator [Bdellovibrio sp. SKB1291214]UYL09447.1 AraC family transcriptional regulator [Bdellovibrio sp. SKB1291214]